MKPLVIYLLRHGESLGQTSREVYKTIPDWKMPLTEKGIEQAKNAAKKLKEDITKIFYHDNALFPVMLSTKTIRVYSSPWYRSRQTAQAFRDVWPQNEYREDPRIREQDWGNYATDEYYKKIDTERDNFGRFFYRMPHGESGADVYDRISTFLESMHRDFQKETYPTVSVIFTHGNALRLFLMRWYHWTVEEYENVKNPKNCDIVKMVIDHESKKYKLVTELRRSK